MKTSAKLRDILNLSKIHIIRKTFSNPHPCTKNTEIEVRRTYLLYQKTFPATLLFSEKQSCRDFLLRVQNKEKIP